MFKIQSISNLINYLKNRIADLIQLCQIAKAGTLENLE
ncbi:hypothetical protein NMS_2498 [Nonlabens marinus S1-08]|uniref:Uncharacterized protein n=1 Tax=Nonlabens marinus S1-08 TaxID=1454201 RepID=W8VXT9_9FLAO|nr:hypothetical protein NMS_2498 [Nonlabens marinus S1-08]